MRHVVATCALALVLTACASHATRPAAAPRAASTTSTSAVVDDCRGQRPPFEPTWVPDEWLLAGGYLPGAEPGGGGGGDTSCNAFHWSGSGRYIDVRVGDGGQAFGEGSREITVLGHPADIGAIHEGFMVQTGDRALLGYGVSESTLERFAFGLHPEPQGAFDERPLGDGIGAAMVTRLDAESVTLDPIGEYGGDDANREAAARGDEVPVSDDHYTVNDDETTQTLALSDALVVTSPWARYGDGGCELCQREISLDRLRELLADTETVGGPANVRNGPWWATVVGGTVVRLDQQYVP